MNIYIYITMAVIPANLIENNISNLQTLSIELKWLWYQMGVSYNTKSAGKCGHLQRDGGSINRLQVYIGDTNVNWGEWYNRGYKYLPKGETKGILFWLWEVWMTLIDSRINFCCEGRSGACLRLMPRMPYIGGESLGSFRR